MFDMYGNGFPPPAPPKTPPLPPKMPKRPQRPPAHTHHAGECAARPGISVSNIQRIPLGTNNYVTIKAMMETAEAAANSAATQARAASASAESAAAKAEEAATEAKKHSELAVGGGLTLTSEMTEMGGTKYTVGMAVATDSDIDALFA